MSLPIVPVSQASSAPVTVKETASSFGLHDAIRYGQRNLSTDVEAKHPIQNRLEKWDETQDNVKLALHRNLYGLHSPLRTLMERQIVSYNPHMPARSTSNLHLDILNGRDETLDVPDFLSAPDAHREVIDIHTSMEKKLGQ